MGHRRTVDGLSRRVFLAQHLSLELPPVVEETVGRNVFSLLILFQDRSQTLCRLLTGLASLLVALQHALPDGPLQVTLFVVVGIFPVHRASQTLLPDVGALRGNRPRTLIADDQLAVLIFEEGCLRCVAPHLCLGVLVTVAILHIDAALAPSVERHAQHNLLVGHTSLAMRLHSIRRTEPADDFRAVERRVVLGCVAHVVGHDVDHVEVLHAALEVDELCAADACQGEPELLAQGFAQVAHQQGEVLCVLRRGANAGALLSGVLPVDVDAVQSQLVADAAAVLGKGHAVLVGSGHLAEATATPPAYAEHDAQLGLLLLQGDDVAKPLLVVDADAVELFIDVPESVVDVRHHRRVGHDLRPRRDVSHDNRLRLAGEATQSATQSDEESKEVFHTLAC